MSTNKYKVIITPTAYKEIKNKIIFVSHMYYNGRDYINNDLL